jgi:hypothetical protein
MSHLTALGLVYLLVGLGCAAAVLARGRGSWLDAALLLLFWPLHGPFLLLSASPEPALAAPARAQPGAPGGHDAGLLDALRRAQGTPLAALLPDQETGRALAARLEQARRRVLEIDALLLQPAFSAQRALERQRELEQAGDRRAAQVAQGRVQHIERLKALRDRSQRELNEVGELIAQLRIQAEVVRLAGADEDTRDLIGELMHRIEGLDAVLEPEPGASPSAVA